MGSLGSVLGVIARHNCDARNCRQGEYIRARESGLVAANFSGLPRAPATNSTRGCHEPAHRLRVAPPRESAVTAASR